MGFFSDLTGSSAKKAIKKSSKQAKADLGAGYTEGNQYYNQAADLFKPYADQGTQANQIYNQAIGLGTPEEQTAAQQRYFSDPAMAAVLGQQTNALLRKYNAGGSGTGGGRLALAGTRVGLENYGGWLNRLQGAGQQGLSATGSEAGIRADQGSLRYGYGATLAGNDINTGNALASASQIGINNLLGIVGAGAKLYGAANGVPVK